MILLSFLGSFSRGLAQSTRQCSRLRRVLSSDLLPVSSSSRTTPKLYTSLLVVRWPELICVKLKFMSGYVLPKKLSLNWIGVYLSLCIQGLHTLESLVYVLPHVFLHLLDHPLLTQNPKALLCNPKRRNRSKCVNVTESITCHVSEGEIRTELTESKRTFEVLKSLNMTGLWSSWRKARPLAAPTAIFILVDHGRAAEYPKRLIGLILEHLGADIYKCEGMGCKKLTFEELIFQASSDYVFVYQKPLHSPFIIISTIPY